MRDSLCSDKKCAVPPDDECMKQAVKILKQNIELSLLIRLCACVRAKDYTFCYWANLVYGERLVSYSFVVKTCLFCRLFYLVKSLVRKRI